MPVPLKQGQGTFFTWGPHSSLSHLPGAVWWVEPEAKVGRVMDVTLTFLQLATFQLCQSQRFTYKSPPKEGSSKNTSSRTHSSWAKTRKEDMGQGGMVASGDSSAAGRCLENSLVPTYNAAIFPVICRRLIWPSLGRTVPPAILKAVPPPTVYYVGWR